MSIQIENGELHPTFWCKTEKIKDNTYNYGKYTYVKGDIPSTRYVILFNLYTIIRISFSTSLYDSKEECFKECDELNLLYKDHPLPTPITYFKDGKECNSYDYSNGKSWWGYIVLDFDLKQIIRVGGYGFKTVKTFKINSHKTYDGIYSLKGANISECRDYFFRDVNIVPDNYKWDTNEYEGWLQYKWGDGKNAINYVKPKKKERPGIDEWWDIYDDSTDTYKRQKVRVVYVGWDDTLPKIEKGIKYMRPNNEPVKFPGDNTGFEGDYSLQEWALSEEIAGDEYLDKGETFNPERTSISIADMLGENNELLKLMNGQ